MKGGPEMKVWDLKRGSDARIGKEGTRGSLPKVYMYCTSGVCIATHIPTLPFSSPSGLDWLSKLTNLVLTHNSLDSESFAIDCPLSYLLRLHTLDLGANELDRFPEVAIQLPK